jgi:hypothetical protein
VRVQNYVKSSSGVRTVVKLERILFRDNDRFIFYFFIKLTNAGLADSAHLLSSFVRERIFSIRRRGIRAEGRYVTNTVRQNDAISCLLAH